MPAPSAAVIARVGAQYARLTLPETAAIQRVTRTPNDSGGSTETTATVATVPSRLAAGVARGLETFAGEVTDVDLWTLTFPAGTDVRTGDRVVINARTFHVQGPDGARSYELTRRVLGIEAV